MIIKRKYFDLFDGYEEYHRHIETTKPIRADLIAQWIGFGSSVLDVGCGDGKNAEILKQKRNAIVTGCDIVDKAKSIIPVIKMDLNKGLFVKDKYDYIVICEVLEHLMRPHKILMAASKIAKKGVIVSIPNSGYFSFRLNLMCGYFPRQSFTHLHFWTLKDFRIFCSQLGLVIQKENVNPTSGMKKIIKKILPNLFAYQLYFFIKLWS